MASGSQQSPHIDPALRPRQEAVSWFIEMGLTVHEAILISVDRDTRMLRRYGHLRVEDAAGKLIQVIEWSRCLLNHMDRAARKSEGTSDVG